MTFPTAFASLKTWRRGRSLIGMVLMLPVGLLCLAIWQSYRIDPYSSRTTIESPYTTSLDETGQIHVNEHFAPKFINSPLAKFYALVKTGIRIPLYSVFLKEERVADTESEIIDTIHRLRFDPSKPYVITGGHYSDLYIRNLGIFFNALLDPRLPTSPEDWQNRQRIALQTVQYDLEFFRQSGHAVTTIVPLDRQAFVGVNIYTEPSDAVHAVLYTLSALRDNSFLANRFPSTASHSAYLLQTTSAADQLLEEYRPALTTVINSYLANLDPRAHLVRRDIHLSSARDGVKRESSFFDNVIMWATVQLADQMAIPHDSTLSNEEWKQRIIDIYWDDAQGIFRDDLTGCDDSGKNCPPAEFSADSLIVTSTGFFDLEQEADHQKLTRMIEYIRTKGLDQPFPLRYTESNKVTPKHLTVRLFAASYMGDGIWSHWGMEYIKALVMLESTYPEGPELARHFLDIYRQNIEKNGGYPELYNSDGTLFRSTLLRGVLHTGWVVNYEQAKMLVEN